MPLTYKAVSPFLMSYKLVGGGEGQAKTHERQLTKETQPINMQKCSSSLIINECIISSL